MIGLIVISSGIAYFLSLPFASLLQGTNYRVIPFLYRAKRWLATCLVGFFLAATIAALAELFLQGVLRYVVSAFVYLLNGGFTLVLHKKMRLRLTVTNRLARMLVASIILFILLFFPLRFVGWEFLWGALPSLSPFVLALSAVLLEPFERRNNDRYIKRAKAILDATSAIKIGITGSYGKTSVKTALEQLLSSKYDTLATPANYNTPLGIAKALAGSDGKEQVMILEMGARRKGDIKELCDLVTPTIGVITGIAPQHLETFGTIDDVAKEKNELARAVAPQNVVYYNLTDERVQALYDVRVGNKVGVGFEGADRVIADVKTDDGGTCFTLKGGEGAIELEVPLFGIAAITDFAIACVIALDLGLSVEELKVRARSIHPASHRFEVMKKGGVTIIDDSYNINPIGAAAALDSLDSFAANRRIVYVSGIVELGEETAEQNRSLGKHVASVADLAIVAESKYGEMVIEGILASDPRFAVIRVSDTSEATATFGKLLKEGDLLLILSDLPRDYLL